MNATVEIGKVNHYMKDPGDLPGHAIPGTVFMIFGFLWLNNTIFKFQVARKEAELKGEKLHSVLRYRNFIFSKYHTGCCVGVPAEPIFGILVAVIGTLGELRMSFRGGQFVIMSAHHSTMYALYGLFGVSGLFLHYGSIIPQKTDYAAFILAKGVQAFMFLGHVTGRTALNNQLHLMLTKIMGVTVFCAGLEMIFKRSILAAVGRSLGLIFEGIWLWVTGLILYPPSFMNKWDQDDHMNLNIVSAIYVIIIIVLCHVAMAWNLVVYKRVQRLSLATIERIQTTMYGRVSFPNSKSDVEKPLISDSDCDI